MADIATFPGVYTLVDRVVATLRQQITAGELAIGEKLPSGTELARQTGVSVAVVREALARLRTQGLIRTRHGSGSVVVSRTESTGFRVGEHAVWEATQLRQLFEFRIDVESAAASHAATAATETDLAQLREALQELGRDVAERRVGTDADLAFHLAIARASRNQYRVQLIEYLNNEVRDAIHIARQNSQRSPGVPGSVHKEHEAICRAIERRQPRQAAEAMKRHLQSAVARLGLSVDDVPGTPR